MKRIRGLALTLALGVTADIATADDLMIYPKDGQSADQQTGLMVISVAGDHAAFVLFGACTVP